jgi:hypothetical protein
LVRHDEFGNSDVIVPTVLARYRFGLELFAERLPGVAVFLSEMAGWPEAAVHAFLDDTVVRAAMERAFIALEQGELRSPHELEWAVEAAQTLFRQTGEAGLVEHAIAYPRRVGPAGQIWFWDLERSTSPRVAAKVRENFDRSFIAGRSWKGEIAAPEPWMAETFDRAFALLVRLLPEVGASILRHFSGISLIRMELNGGRLLTGSAGDGLPRTTFISPDESRNPWDTIVHILHEGLHQKFNDIARLGALVQDDSTVRLPWRDRAEHSMSRIMYAFHVYVHLTLYQAAVKTHGPELYGEFGALDAHPVSAHAMSVVKNEAGVPYARAVERCRYLGEQLSTTWAQRLTPDARRIVRWLLECIQPLGTEATAFLPAAGHGGRASPPSSAASASADRPLEEREPSDRRYAKSPSLRTRSIEELGSILTFAPERPSVQLLNLNSWLIYELCDGQTEREIWEAYADIVCSRLSADLAWQQLRHGLHHLEARRVIVPVPAVQPA